MHKRVVREQFGANAAAYVSSKPHAKGASLARLVEIVQPQPAWKVLDIATAAGHTAFAFAPHVEHVWATDITPEMLETATRQAMERGLANVTVEQADADALPYAQATFDLVACRIAPHHFGDITPFMRESARVLKSGGILAVVDNVVPRGDVGDYINAFEKLRDPSHWRCLTVEEWRAAFHEAGLTLIHEELLDKVMDFATWAARHDPIMQRYLRAMLTASGEDATQALNPNERDGATTFQLTEGIFVGCKRSPAD